MVDHCTREGDPATKASLGSESGVRKFTLSCSRCRISKLKCDREEPCMECVTRNVGHLCTKDERQPRAKRAKTDHNSHNHIKNNASQACETEAEDAAQILEHFVDGSSHPNTYTSAVYEPLASSVALDYPNIYWSASNDAQRQGEQLALIREIVDAMPQLDIIDVLYEVFVTRCQGPLAAWDLLRPNYELRPCPGRFPWISSLVSSWRCLVLALAFHRTPPLFAWSPTPLSLHVDELRASNVHFKTWKSLAVRCLQGGTSLFCGSIASLQATIMLLLEGQEGFLTLDAILVTAISGAQKLGLHRLGDARLETSKLSASSFEDDPLTLAEPPQIRTELGIRIWWALVMRDWSRGQALGYYSISPSQFSTRMPLHINDEDIYPTTLNFNVDGYITERPRSEFTMLSYTVHALEIAVFLRESIDLRGPLRQPQQQGKIDEGTEMRNYLNKKYEKFVARLPSYFRIGSTAGLASTGPMAAIPVHRWMLHQQLWSLFLRLYRGSLSSQGDRTPCQLLAQNIISSQTQIQARCAVCGSLSSSETQLFSAAIVLLIGLLFSSNNKDADRSSVQLSRLMTRDKIQEAIDLLQMRSDAGGSSSLQEPQPEPVKVSAQRSAIALEALMKLEEEESDLSEENNGRNSTGNPLGGQEAEYNRRARKSLKVSVMDTLKTLQRTTETKAAVKEQANINSFSAVDLSSSLPTATDEFQDLDVLPLLFDDASSDFWQFSDFDLPPPSPTENGPFIAKEDL